MVLFVSIWHTGLVGLTLAPYSETLTTHSRRRLMAKKKTSNGKPLNKMEVVRQILAANPNAKASEIAHEAKTKHSVDIEPKMAGTYRYHVLSKQRRVQRKAVRAVQAANPSATDTSDGVDDLLRAARKLGWQRVNEIVQGILNAPT